MVMYVDIERASVEFADIKNSLEQLGEEMNLSVKIQREEIFEAMYTI